MALYARLAGDALASFRRREVQRDIEKAVQEISRALVVHVDPEGAPTPLLPIMLKPLLSLYQRLTGAEVVLYRHYDEGSLSPLRLTSTPVFASEDLAEQMSVPRDVPVSVVARITPIGSLFSSNSGAEIT